MFLILLDIPPPPDLVSVLAPFESILVAIVAIGSIKLVVWAVYWNHKKINDFIKSDWKDKKSSSIEADILRATRARIKARKERDFLARLEKREVALTDSANWWAIITNPFTSFMSWIRGWFK